MKQHNKPCQGKVYMFHDVSSKSDTYSISADSFSQLLDYLDSTKNIVTVEELVNNPHKDNVVLTFDDAYGSVYHNAYPILKQNRVPYYVFICVDYLNKEKYLSLEMLKQMLSDSNCIIGSHNMKHDMARFKDLKQLDDDLLKSKQVLENLSGSKINSFAFPYGSMYACSDEDIEYAKKHYDYVFMTYGVAYNKDYGNIIPRININSENYRKEIE